MKKRTKIILISLLLLPTVILLVMGTITLVKYFNEPKVNDNDNENKNNEKIYLFNKQMNSLDELNEQDVQDYIKIVAFLFKEKTYTSFTDDEIATIVAYKLLINGEVATNEQIEKFVESYFGKKDFQLKEGEYYSSNDETVLITKDGDKFMSNLWGKGGAGQYNIYQSMEVSNNQVIVHYDYGDISIATEVKTVIGYTDIYLEYTKGDLIIKKIVYTEK